MSHNCKATGKLGEYLFLCSRCGRCYVCHHTFVYFEGPDEWRVKCRGKFVSVIFDGKLRSNEVLDPPSLEIIKSTDEALIDQALKDYLENGDELEKQATKGFNGKEWLIAFPKKILRGLF